MKLPLLSIVAVATCTSFAAAAETKPARPFAPADLFALRRAGNAQISPDGRFVAYVRSSSDIGIDGEHDDVMIVNVSDGHERLIASSARMPRWSPDGTTLAYVAGGTHVVLKPMVGGASRQFDVPGGVGSLAWSPDAQRLAYTSFVAETPPSYIAPVAKPANATWAKAPRVITSAPYQQDGQHGYETGHTQLFVTDASGTDVRQLTFAQTDVDGTPVWVRDGAALIYSALPTDFRKRLYTNARLYSVPASGGAPAVLSPDGIGARAPVISPDGSTVAFVGARPTGHDYAASVIYLMDAAGTNVRRLTPASDAEMGTPTFAPDGRSILAAHPSEGKTVLTRFQMNGDSQEVVASVGGDAGFTIANDGTIAFLTGSFDHPADVAIVKRRGEVRALTSLNRKLLEQRRLAVIRPLTFVSKLDGADVRSWLVCPPGGDCKNLPAILMIHGGPYGYDDPTWNSEDQLLAAAGYAILHVNYRGSLGYGFAFSDRIARDWPNPAYVDLMSGVDAAIASGIADRNRLFVAGGSAGGELAAWTLGSTDRFKAGAVVKPVINQISNGLVTDQFANLGAGVGALPWENPMAYWRQSALSRVGNVSTPTLVMVGEEDHRTPIGEAQQFFNALQLRGVPSEFVMFPDAGHNSIYGTPSRLAAGVALQLDWFARYGGLPAPVAVTTGQPSLPR